MRLRSGVDVVRPLTKLDTNLKIGMLGIYAAVGIKASSIFSWTPSVGCQRRKQNKVERIGRRCWKCWVARAGEIIAVLQLYVQRLVFNCMFSRRIWWFWATARVTRLRIEFHLCLALLSYRDHLRDVDPLRLTQHPFVQRDTSWRARDISNLTSRVPRSLINSDAKKLQKRRAHI